MVALLLAQHFEVVSDCGGPLAPPVNDVPATQLALGGAFGCSADDGVVTCWGANDVGQLGRGTTSAFEPLGRVTLDESIAQLTAGQTSACARTVKGRVFCWGDNAHAQLGRADPLISSTPLEVSVPVPVAKLAMHADYALALGSDGRLFGWGNDSEGVLGRGDENPMAWPVPRPVLRAAFDLRFKDVSAGQGHACGIDLDDALWCWGRNTNQNLGTASMEMQLRAPVRVLDGVSRVVAGAFATCALRGGAVWCWGDVPLDEQGTVFRSVMPREVDFGGATVRAVDYQWFHFCAVTTEGRAFCWGRGAEGQLGIGTTTPEVSPRALGVEVRELATGFFFSCARHLDGSVACTGENAQGQLGLGDTDRRATLTAQ